MRFVPTGQASCLTRPTGFVLLKTFRRSPQSICNHPLFPALVIQAGGCLKTEAPAPLLETIKYSGAYGANIKPKKKMYENEY
jgi:hypothetical protein